MVKVSHLGYPRLGEQREWKQLIESYWDGKISQDELKSQAKWLRLSFLKKQEALGVDLIPVGDFSLYDHILDLSFQFELIPERFSQLPYDLDLYFAMARGTADGVALAMKKWFNTNYHYLVPEWSNREPHLRKNHLLELYLEAREVIGDKAKPVITGPLTYVSLSSGVTDVSSAVRRLLPIYQQIFQELVDAGATFIQVDEPIFVMDEGRALLDLAKEVYGYFEQHVPRAQLIFQTYFESLIDVEGLADLPVAALGLDFVHGLADHLAALEAGHFDGKVIFAGVVDGRNVWGTDLEAAKCLIETLQKRGIEVYLQPSCSLLHVPVTTKAETALEPVLKNGLAFADEKLQELRILANQLEQSELLPDFVQKVAAFHALQAADFRHVALEDITTLSQRRSLPFEQRRLIQQDKLQLPILPTTTIGSFPQSVEVRHKRLAWKRQQISDRDYEAFIKQEITRWIRLQEDLGLDVLVHGEFERVDMVEFFGQKLTGFATTVSGWVQSYGSRVVKPPIIYGDVQHTQPLTVNETVYAQSLTKRPVKGMLTGPITITNWSFERTDISRQTLFNQIALAIRAEIKLLEDAGIPIIQVDEAAIREGLPLRKEMQQAYLTDAVEAFRLATAAVKDSTQIHTHMCYSQFAEIMEAIRELDADVISIEASRSQGDIIKAFETITYPAGIGLGVYDIHSPRVPSLDEIVTNIERSLQQLSVQQFWVNPDCGLKTRREPETLAALQVLVEATKSVRQRVSTREEKKE